MDLTKSPIRNPQFEILGVHPGALGDVILFAQLLSGLKARDGGRVRLIAGGEKARLLAGLGALDEAIDFESLPMEEVFTDRPADECRLPMRLGDAPRSARLLVSCFAGGDARAEQRLAELCSAERTAFLPIRPPENFARHLVELWARELGLASAPSPHWPVPEGWRGQAKEALLSVGASEGEPYLLIHPGAGAPAKCWPLDRFAALALAMTAIVPKAIFVIGPAEQERWGKEILDAISAEFPTIRSPSLSVLAGLAAEAKAYVGNDSGPSHLAAAVGTPSVVLFGPTNPVHFAPRGHEVRVLRSADLAELSVARVAEMLELF